jgi:hypothetical protein
VDEVSTDRKHMKGGGPKASGCTLPVFAHKAAYPGLLQCMASILKVKDVKDLDPTTPLFASRVRKRWQPALFSASRPGGLRGLP